MAYDFIMKKNEGKRWEDISEAEVFNLLLIKFCRDEVPDQIYRLKCGHQVKTIAATFEAYPKVGEFKCV